MLKKQDRKPLSPSNCLPPPHRPCRAENPKERICNNGTTAEIRKPQTVTYESRIEDGEVISHQAYEITVDGSG
ncbi:hypothetical protein TNIN_89271 [Trichonephila inaurata madagascariensis]|uniref:Uncharacterized protein n=1 Tax=Trichonephila inaurata madagascariensis TaxID=2747483 RepID=A0A8X6YW64_9ARAC|nr:hypothetical protein TNIN_89271 [Trichonephila inaurata madagascariensis]